MLHAAAERSPAEIELLYALSTIHRDRGDAAAALRYARKLLELDPGNQGLQAFVAELEKATG